MFSVWKNGKCLSLYKTYKGAKRRYETLCNTSDIEKDCIELYRYDYLLEYQ